MLTLSLAIAMRLYQEYPIKTYYQVLDMTDVNHELCGLTTP